MKSLNEVAGQGRSLSFVVGHVDHVKTLYPAELGDWTSDQYLGFLYGRSLIIRHDDQFHITNLGVEYLTWITRNGRRENNAL